MRRSVIAAVSPLFFFYCSGIAWADCLPAGADCVDVQTLERQKIETYVAGISEATITVTNTTGVTWTDFTFDFQDVPNPDEFISIIIGATPSPFTTQTKSNTGPATGKNTITYAGGSVPDGNSFTAPFLWVTSNSDTTDVFGTPSVPEPSTWAMLLIGFAGLAFSSYRALHKGAARPA